MSLVTCLVSRVTHILCVVLLAPRRFELYFRDFVKEILCARHVSLWTASDRLSLSVPLTLIVYIFLPCPYVLS